MTETRQVAAVTGDGRIVLLEQPTPERAPGRVLIDVHASLVSPGTELAGGWRRFAERRERPVAQPEPRPFGYSSTGIVLAAGEGVETVQPGQRVAGVGMGYALHATRAVVPQQLCAPLPDSVSFEQGAYAMLAATGLHALRRGRPEFGDLAAVAGLGLVGLLTAQLYEMNGVFVIGWDLIEKRLDLARRTGVHAVARVGRDDVPAVTRDFTAGAGLDGGVLAIPGDANAAVADMMKAMKVSPDGHAMGTIVVVGGSKFDYPAGTHNVDFVRAARTGPGYHDDTWEHDPRDYPPVFVRWTTRSNLALCLRLIAEGRLKVDPLTTHRIPLADVEAGVDGILDAPDDILGVVFAMK